MKEAGFEPQFVGLWNPSLLHQHNALASRDSEAWVGGECKDTMACAFKELLKSCWVPQGRILIQELGCGHFFSLKLQVQRQPPGTKPRFPAGEMSIS